MTVACYFFLPLSATHVLWHRKQFPRIAQIFGDRLSVEDHCVSPLIGAWCGNLLDNLPWCQCSVQPGALWECMFTLCNVETRARENVPGNGDFRHHCYCGNAGNLFNGIGIFKWSVYCAESITSWLMQSETVNPQMADRNMWQVISFKNSMYNFPRSCHWKMPYLKSWCGTLCIKCCSVFSSLGLNRL